MSAQEKSRDFSAEPHLPYMEGEDYRLCNACKQPAGASIHLRRDSRQCQAFYPLHGRPCPNMAVDADPNDGERALCANCLKNANGAPWTPWSEGYYHSDNGSWEPRGDYTHWVPKAKAPGGKAPAESKAEEHVCIAFVGGLCPVCNGKNPTPPIKPGTVEHECRASKGVFCSICNAADPVDLPLALKEFIVEYGVWPDEWLKEDQARGKPDTTSDNLRRAMAEFLIAAHKDEADRAAATDNTTLHAIQMAYSAMERALAVPAVKGVRPGLVEVEQWLSDAKSYVASLRDLDRQLHEAQVAFEEEALLSKPKF
jgi:hypothetical protein